MMTSTGLAIPLARAGRSSTARTGIAAIKAMRVGSVNFMIDQLGVSSECLIKSDGFVDSMGEKVMKAIPTA